MQLLRKNKHNYKLCDKFCNYFSFFSKKNNSKKRIQMFIHFKKFIN